MSVFIEKECDLTLSFDYEELIKDVVNEALDYVGCPFEAMVSILLTDNEAIQELNRTYRHIDRATDVLSFPSITYETPADFSRLEEEPETYFDPESGELLFGDIVISLEKVREQAALYGHSEKRELAFLVAHSMLHLAGYDHMEAKEREQMEARQEEILQKLHLTRG